MTTRREFLKTAVVGASVLAFPGLVRAVPDDEFIFHAIHGCMRDFGYKCVRIGRSRSSPMDESIIHYFENEDRKWQCFRSARTGTWIFMYYVHYTSKYSNYNGFYEELSQIHYVDPNYMLRYMSNDVKLIEEDTGIDKIWWPHGSSPGYLKKFQSTRIQFDRSVYCSWIDDATRSGRPDCMFWTDAYLKHPDMTAFTRADGLRFANRG